MNALTSRSILFSKNVTKGEHGFEEHEGNTFEFSLENYFIHLLYQ